MKNVILSSLDNALRHFLRMIERSGGFALIATEDGKSAGFKEISDELCGELYGEDGWIAKYSDYSSTERTIFKRDKNEKNAK